MYLYVIFMCYQLVSNLCTVKAWDTRANGVPKGNFITILRPKQSSHEESSKSMYVC